MTETVPWISIPALVRDAAARFGDREAVADGETRYSFAELADRVSTVARATIAAGIASGDRVAIWAPNLSEWIEAGLGALAAGAVLVPLNTRYKGREAADILRRSGARLLFTVTGFLDTDHLALLHEAGAPPEALECTVVLRGEPTPGTTAWADFLGGGATVGAAEAREREERIGPTDLSDLIFTSGTTGSPKGVMTAHGQSLQVFETWSRLVGLREGDRYLVVNPFFHTFGYKAGIIAAIMRGATIVPHAVFDADAVLRRIGDERITMLPGPPALYQSLLHHRGLADADIGSLRLAVTGAASIPVSLIEQMHTELGFDTVLTAYGLTEATGVVSMCREGDDAVTIATTSGCAIPGVEIRTVDDEGRDVTVGEPGEVLVRGYNVMRGYLDDPEETARTVDPDGWLHTGDVGVLDERGYLDITDRKKDMFIVGGFNAYPAEIENALVEHEAIAQAAVVGMADDRLGEVGCAFVVLRSGRELDPDAVIAWARDRMANFKVPRRIEVVDALPTNASGKVLKGELRERAARWT